MCDTGVRDTILGAHFCLVVFHQLIAWQRCYKHDTGCPPSSCGVSSTICVTKVLETRYWVYTFVSWCFTGHLSDKGVRDTILGVHLCLVVFHQPGVWQGCLVTPYQVFFTTVIHHCLVVSSPARSVKRHDTVKLFFFFKTTVAYFCLEVFDQSGVWL